MAIYSNRNEAITREIIEPIQNGDVTDAHDTYDIDAIADKVIGDFAEGFALTVDETTFWQIVENQAF